MANLDINHLIAQQNGGVVAEKVSDAEVVQRLRALESQPQFARGVDLAAIRDKKFRQHKWTMLATFELAEDVVQGMWNQRQEIAGFLAQDLQPPEMEPVNIPMGSDNVIDTQGPGCVKCGVLWEAPEGGFGAMCGVDDRQWEQAREQMRGQQGMERNREMERLVGIERGKL